MITISLNLSKIPKEKITTGKDGCKYVNITLNERKAPDKFGNTHFVAMYKTKEERNEQTVYIGSGKTVDFRQPTFQPAEDDSLPF